MGIDLKRAHEHCSKHRKEIERSELCGCFYCEKIFTRCVRIVGLILSSVQHPDFNSRKNSCIACASGGFLEKMTAATPNGKPADLGAMMLLS
jgi:hypothetical protein